MTAAEYNSSVHMFKRVRGYPLKCAEDRTAGYTAAM